VEAGRDELPAVRAERQRADSVVMLGEVVQALPGSSVPDPDVPIPAPGRQALAVPAERHADALVRVPPEWPQDELTGLPVPAGDGAVMTHGESPAVRAERHAISRPAVVGGAAWTLEVHFVARRPFPHLHLSVHLSVHALERAGGGQVLSPGV